MREMRGKNGALIVINPAPFKTVKQLRKAIANELLKQKIDIGKPKSLDNLSKLFKDNLSQLLNVVKDVLLGLEVSEEFERVLWACLQECTYDSIIISETLFDDKPEARADYDNIVKGVVEENLSPFIKNLAGLLNTNTMTAAEDLQ